MHLRTRSSRWATVVSLTTVLVTTGAALAGTAAPASADPLAPLSLTDQRVHDSLVMRSRDPKLGADTTGLVTDLATGRILWSQHRLTRQLPASTTKLVTAVNALETFGADHRFTTTVLDGATPDHVVLVGGGDPSLTSTDLNTLAVATASALTVGARPVVNLLVDDSLFPAPSLAVGWARNYVPRDIRPVRALVVNQHKQMDTSLDAGKMFAAQLRALGITVVTVRRGRDAVAGPALATVAGQPLSLIVSDMLHRSDNDHAEALHRLVALTQGFPATWRGSAAAQRVVLRRLGVELGTSRLYDGSGLSRAGRLTARQLVSVLTLAYSATHPALVSLQHDDLPIAGQTGTLAANFKRFNTVPTSCAAGLVEAKTGSLQGVVSLAGYAQGADGQLKVFAFLVNGKPATLTTRRAVDRLASTVTGCW